MFWKIIFSNKHDLFKATCFIIQSYWDFLPKWRSQIGVERTLCRQNVFWTNVFRRKDPEPTCIVPFLFELKVKQQIHRDLFKFWRSPVSSTKTSLSLSFPDQPLKRFIFYKKCCYINLIITHADWLTEWGTLRVVDKL